MRKSKVFVGARDNRVLPLVTVEIRMELLKRNWSLRQLAARCRVAYSRIAHQVEIGVPSQRTRRMIESAFGWPMFSSPREWNRRKALTEALGMDPFLVNRIRLQQRAKSLGIPTYKNGFPIRKDELIRAIERHLKLR